MRGTEHYPVRTGLNDRVEQTGAVSLFAKVGPIHGDAEPAVMTRDAATDLRGGIEHSVEFSRSGGFHPRGRGDHERRGAGVAAQACGKLMIKALLHPTFPLWLRGWAWCLRQPRKMPS